MLSLILPEKTSPGTNSCPIAGRTKKNERIIESRTNPGRTLTEAIGLAARKPRVLVQASGVNYYGTGGDEILDRAFPDWERLPGLSMQAVGRCDGPVWKKGRGAPGCYSHWTHAER